MDKGMAPSAPRTRPGCSGAAAPPDPVRDEAPLGRFVPRGAPGRGRCTGRAGPTYFTTTFTVIVLLAAFQLAVLATDALTFTA